jgi:spore cortex biosynthesis protein YabQ
MFSTSNQAYVFLATVYAGFIIGFIYDCCRMIRKITKPGIFLTGIMDLLFWIVIGALSFLVIFYVNDGEVRIYTIAGFAIGWALYVLTLSPYIMKALTWIYTTLARMLRWLMNLILWPFRLLKKALGYPVRWMKKGFSALIRKIKKLMAGITFKKRNKKGTQKEEF